MLKWNHPLLYTSKFILAAPGGSVIDGKDGDLSKFCVFASNGNDDEIRAYIEVSFIAIVNVMLYFSCYSVHHNFILHNLFTTCLVLSWENKFFTLYFHIWLDIEPNNSTI